MAAEDVRHLESRGRIDTGSVGRDHLNRELIEWAARDAGNEIRLQLRRTASGQPEIDMAKQDLDDPDVDAALQKVGSKGMPKRVDGHGFAKSRATPCGPACALDCAGSDVPLGSRPGNNHRPGRTRFQ